MVSRYWMNHSGLIGAFLRNMLIFPKRIRNIRYLRTLIVLSNTKRILISKIIPSFFVDKASCTRQFESVLSMHSLSSLFPIKEGTNSRLGLLPSGKKRKNAPWCSEPLRNKVSGPSKVSPDCAGWNSLGNSSLQLYINISA